LEWREDHLNNLHFLWMLIGGGGDGGAEIEIVVGHLSGQRCQLPGFGLKDPGAGLQDTLSMILAGDSV